MSCVPPELLDLYWSLLSPYLDGEVPFQHGTNDPADCISELLGLKPNYPDEFLHNDPSSQKNLAFDRETMENMESVKDDGSHSAPSAKMLNALVSTGSSQYRISNWWQVLPRTFLFCLSIHLLDEVYLCLLFSNKLVFQKLTLHCSCVQQFDPTVQDSMWSQ
jgi:hypothetical protein